MLPVGFTRAEYLARCASGDGDDGNLHGSGGGSRQNFTTPALPFGAPTVLLASNKDDLAGPAAAGGRLSLPSRAVLTLAPLAKRLGLVRRIYARSRGHRLQREREREREREIGK